MTETIIRNYRRCEWDTLSILHCWLDHTWMAWRGNWVDYSAIRVLDTCCVLRVLMFQV